MAGHEGGKWRSPHSQRSSELQDPHEEPMCHNVRTLLLRENGLQLPGEPAFGYDVGLDASGILIGPSIILRDRPICSSLGGEDSQVLLAI